MITIQQGKFQEAEAISRQVLSIDIKAYGMEHSIVAVDLHNLALSLKQQVQPASNCFLKPNTLP